MTIYGTYDFTRHWGIEGDVHRASSITPADIGEDSYLIGPRYALRYNRIHPYAKALFGLGRDVAPRGRDPLGGGIDIALTRGLNLRAVDFEYQQWPGYPPDGLTPKVWTFGAAYTFH